METRNCERLVRVAVNGALRLIPLLRLSLPVLEIGPGSIIDVNNELVLNRVYRVKRMSSRKHFNCLYHSLNMLGLPVVDSDPTLHQYLCTGGN